VHDESLICHEQVNQHVKNGFDYVHKMDHGMPKPALETSPKHSFYGGTNFCGAHPINENESLPGTLGLSEG
jgi:hypothetical protein